MGQSSDPLADAKKFLKGTEGKPWSGKPVEPVTTKAATTPPPAAAKPTTTKDPDDKALVSGTRSATSAGENIKRRALVQRELSGSR